MAEALMPMVVSLASCRLAADAGPCDAFAVKWFYDVRLVSCRRFWYGGCEGNDNRFETRIQCAKSCEMVREKVEFDDKKYNSEITDRCKLERSRGPCANYTLKWYYDDQASMCNMFWYGGCGGNDNRFEKEDECESTCVTNDGTGKSHTCITFIPYLQCFKLLSTDVLHD